MSEPDQTQATLRSLRERVDELKSKKDTLSADARFAALSGALGVALIAFTAMNWAIAPDGGTAVTLWDMADEDSPQGIAALLAILALGTSTAIVALLPSPGRISLGVLIGLAIAVTVPVLLIEAVFPVDYAKVGSTTVYDSGPARWLALVTALALATVHGARLGQSHPDNTHQRRNHRH